MRNISLTTIALLWLLSCSPSTPEYLLPESKMVGILIRLHIAEAKVQHSMLVNDTLQIFYKHMEDSILARYNVSKTQFEGSYEYYVKNIEKMDKIYAQVIDSLSLREALGKID